MIRTMPATRLVVLLGDWRSSPSPVRRPLADLLSTALRALVVDGRVPVGVRLPADRDLATALGVSRGVASAAYDRMREEGLLERRVGAGSFTALPVDSPLPAGAWGPRTGGGPDVVDLTMASLPAPPTAMLAAVAEANELLPAHLGSSGYDLLGLPELRAAIADRYTSLGAPTTPEQVLVTTGGQAALDLLARTVLTPGDTALVEVPTYPNALDSLRTARARLHPVPVDGAEGWDPVMLVDALRRGPRLAYLVPDFHNPTGAVMPDDVRARVLDASRRSGTVTVVDEAMADLVLDGPEPARTARLDARGQLVSVGSLSKSVWGGLRTGWLRADPSLVRRVAEVRAVSDMGPPILGQLVALALLRRLDGVVADRRELLRPRRDALVAALAERLPAWRTRVPRGGMSLWVALDAPGSTALAAAAPDAGLRLAPGPRFGIDGAFDRFVRLPFTPPEPVLVDAVDRLAGLWGSVVGGFRPPVGSRILV
ncbi:MocR-like transcription factor YczR [Motilibacter deserti]|uniref:PLP-dependent aminotransferase family protein n=1 Tax=Motilibacter deserti TaxID=2714956 RepID=A0ABX0GZQ1_9ACTN|nr:PLP-dependent aminotransferase family protein [Motilibacter deserti]NHC15249.1 PLP-dependent aminotransferase family protein [Motilibacter deserti]